MHFTDSHVVPGLCQTLQRAVAIHVPEFYLVLLAIC
jgi:hypothetical protein